MASTSLRPAVTQRVPAPVDVPARGGPSNAWLVWMCLGIVYVVWGSTYLAIRVVDETMPPLLTSGVRFLIAGAIVYAVLLARGGRAAVRITHTQLVSCALIGSLLVAGGNGLVMVGELHVPSGVAALIIASVPLWVVLYRRLGGERVARGTLAGVGVGFAGVALLLLPGGSGGGVQLVSLLVVCAAAPCWALGSYLSGRKPLPDNPFLSTAWQMMLGGVASLAAGAARGELGHVHAGAFSGRSLAGFAYLIVFGSLIAFTSYVWVLQHAPVSKVATYAYVNPVIAIFLGWAILSEHVTGTILAGAAIVVASVAAIVRKESG
ncbi:MAG TPA: EamA family transporter [Thermoleophilaceae bacterium]